MGLAPAAPLGEKPAVRLAELIAALSLATDLGTGQPIEHALRSCVVAVRLAETIGLSDTELRDVYYLALLRFMGCTADAHVTASMFGDEVAAAGWFATVDSGQPVDVLLAMVRHVSEGDPPLQRARRLATAVAGAPRMLAVRAAHCEVAQQLAQRLDLGPTIHACFAQIYERWDGKGQPGRLRADEIARPVRVMQLAQDAEIFHRLGGVDAAVAIARQRSGGAYDPHVAERFCRAAGGLLAGLGTEAAWEAALAAEPGPQRILSEPELDTTLRAIADFVDLKSPYLGGHSSGVADLAAEAARHCKLAASDIRIVQRAGWVHDIGRVGISSAVWGRPGPLTQGEWERVRLHPYYTERVLARPQAIAHLGVLASLHHERLDGTGYHRGAPATMLRPEARLLAAADVYHALTETRPHRPARSPEAAASELQAAVRAGRLDAVAVNAVLDAAGHRIRRRRRDWPAGLSEREVQVLRLVARGLSDGEMAERLYLSKSTVHHHVQHIYDKLGVSTRAAATHFALQHDLLEAGWATEK
jgi:HD-GYP domain-containing protein (c-di-GMP phosphodiesterase class II)